MGGLRAVAHIVDQGPDDGVAASGKRLRAAIAEEIVLDLFLGTNDLGTAFQRVVHLLAKFFVQHAVGIHDDIGIIATGCFA